MASATEKTSEECKHRIVRPNLVRLERGHYRLDGMTCDSCGKRLTDTECPARVMVVDRTLPPETFAEAMDDLADALDELWAAIVETIRSWFSFLR